MELFHFNIVEWTLLGILGVLFLIQLYWYSRYMAAVARKIRRDKKSQISNLQSQIPQ